MRRILAHALVLAVVLSLLTGLSFGPATIAAAAEPSNTIIINQVYGRADKDAAAVSHSFIELYNPTDSPVDLSPYSIQVGTTGLSWQSKALSGTLPAHTSYLIRCTERIDDSATAYTINTADMDWDIAIDNKDFKVAIALGHTVFGVAAPVEYVIDAVGSAGSDFYWGTAGVSDISKQKSARRIALSNTGDNAVDFQSIDYRNLASTGKLEEMRPKSTADGAWEPTPPAELTFSQAGGLYADQFNLTLATNDNTAKIYYTTDGSEPTTSSTLYAGAITIKDRTSDPNVLSEITNIDDTRVYTFDRYTPPTVNFKGTVIRARVYDNSGNPLTNVITNSYFVSADIFARYGDLPVISLSTDADNFFDDNIGIYVNPTWYDDVGYYDSPNWDIKGSDWERPIHMEYFDETTGAQILTMDMGVRINGGATRRVAQKALRLYAKAGYDSANPTVQYDLFQGGATDTNGLVINDFKRLVLRNFGNEGSYTTMRDAAQQELCKSMNFDIQAARPCVVFLNGEFWGMYNIRERYDNEYFASHYGVDKDDVALLEVVNSTVDINEGDEGDVVDYWAMWNFFDVHHDFDTAERYAQAQTYIDIDNFIDYNIAEIFFGNIDWPNNNIKLWRYKVDYDPNAVVPYGHDGRWRWVLSDLDSTSGGGGFSHQVDFNSLTRVLDITKFDNGYVDGNSTKILRRLMTNEEFKTKFINRFCDLMNTTLHSDVYNDMITKYENLIADTMDDQLVRWQRTDSPLKGTPDGTPAALVAHWEGQVDILRDFADRRQGYMLGFMQDWFALGNQIKLTVSNNAAQGTVALNGIALDSATSGGFESASVWSGQYFPNAKQTITATAASGYRFSKFTVQTSSGTTEYTANPLTITLTSNTTVTAVYVTEAGTDTVIRSSTLNGVTQPIYDAPCYTASTLSTTDSNYTITSLTWLPAHTTFATETAYTATIVLTAKSGYTFANGLVPSVGAGTASTGVLSNSNKTLTFTVAFPATSTGPRVSYDILTEATVIGTDNTMIYYDVYETFDMTTTEYLFMKLSGYSSSKYWNWAIYYTDSNGIAGVIKAMDDYKPAGWQGDYDGMFWLRGHFEYRLEHDASASNLDMENITITQIALYFEDGLTASYPKLQVFALGQPPAVKLTGLVAPVTGQTPVTKAAIIPDNHAYSVTSITWSPSASSFAPDTVYTAEIVLTQANGYIFHGTITPQVNAGTASAGIISELPNGVRQLTFTVTFPKTEPVVTNYTVAVSATAGGSVSGGGTYSAGTSVTVTASANSGYDFSGWYENNTRVSTSATYSFTLTANRTLQARFTAQGSGGIVPPPPAKTTYNVFFNSNGGTAVATQTVEEGETATLPTPPTRTDYTFGGWYSNAALSGSAYNFNTPVTANITLYAKWTYAWPNGQPSQWAQEEVLSAIEHDIIPTDLLDDYKQEMNRLNFCRVAIHFIEYVSEMTIDEFLADKGLTLRAAYNDCDEKVVLAASALGIVDGIGGKDNIFEPERGIMRAEAAKMLALTCHALGIYNPSAPQTSYDDQATIPKTWAAPYVNFVTDINIMHSTSDYGNVFAPFNTYTTEQSIVTFERLRAWQAK